LTTRENALALTSLVLKKVSKKTGHLVQPKCRKQDKTGLGWSARHAALQRGSKSRKTLKAAQEKVSCAREHSRSSRLIREYSSDRNCPNHG
jgi:hypothetical protein